MEKDAYGVGAAALAPWETLFPAMNRGVPIDELGELYDVISHGGNQRIAAVGV